MRPSYISLYIVIASIAPSQYISSSIYSTSLVATFYSYSEQMFKTCNLMFGTFVFHCMFFSIHTCYLHVFTLSAFYSFSMAFHVYNYKTLRFRSQGFITVLCSVSYYSILMLTHDIYTAVIKL